MSFVHAAPDRLVAASRNLAGIGSTLSASNATAAAPTLAVSAAASDQVSAAVAAFFSGHAQGYQTLSAQAARFHNEFVQALTADASSYATAESANASPLRQLLNAASDVAAPGDSGTVQANTGTPASRIAVPDDAGGMRSGGPASPPAGAAVGPISGAAPPDCGRGSVTEGPTAGGTYGSGGLLLRAASMSEAAAGWSGGGIRAGTSGGLLSRLVDADGGNDRSGRGTRNGVWLDGIRGAGLAAGGNGTTVVAHGRT